MAAKKNGKSSLILGGNETPKQLPVCKFVVGLSACELTDVLR
jgi:hypothetical protein